MKTSEKALLYRELAKLVGANFHLDRALQFLLSYAPSHARRSWLQGLQRGLAEGLSITEALRTHCGPFIGTLELALIDAGERSGRLGDGLTHLARYYEAWHMAQRQALGALVYPLLLAQLGIVLPELPALVTASVNSAPASLRSILVSLGAFFVLIFIVFLVWRWLARRGAESAVVDAWLGRLPLIGSVRRHWALARFSQVFHACLLASMRMTECIRLAGAASHSGTLRVAAQGAAQRIAAGETIAGALADVHGFPLVFVHGVATAEEAGTLDHEMNRWAASETIEARDAVQRAAQWLPKVLYGMVVLYVAYRLIGMLHAYYGGMMQQFNVLGEP